MSPEQIWKEFEKHEGNSSSSNKWYHGFVTKKLFQRIFNYSSFAWAISIIGFISVLALATHSMTHDPDFGAGQPEHYLLLPMLIFGGLGMLSFVVMLLSWLLVHYTKGESFKPAVPSKYFVITALFLLFGTLTFLFGWKQGQVIPASFTGEESFVAINNYRVSNGLTPLTIDPVICDNLVQRWIDVTSSDVIGHKGSEEWAQKEGLNTKYAMAEVYMKNVRTPEEAVDWWAGSPGHKTALLGDYSVGCAYASDGTVVAVFGKPL